MVIGEAPGQDEDIQGKCFVGRAGRELMRLLSLSGMDTDKIYFTNSVKHWPGEGNPKPKAAELSACKPWLELEFKMVDPDIVILAGNTAVANLLGPKVSLKKEHGIARMVQLYGRPRMVYVMYHPAAGMHQPGLRPIIEEDYKKIDFRIVTEQQEAYIHEDVTCKCDTDTTFALDLETTSLDTETCQVVCASYSNGSRVVVHSGLAMTEFFNKVHNGNSTVIIHNAQYDNAILKRIGYGIHWGRVYDTMLSSYILGKDLGLKIRALKDLGLVLETYNDVGEGETDASQIPIERLHPYAAMDSVAAYALYELDSKAIQEQNSSRIFNIESDLAGVLYDMKKRGVMIDKAQMNFILLELTQKRLEKMYDFEMALVRRGIHNININSSQQIADVLFTKLNIPIQKITPGGKPSTDSETLQSISHLAPDIIEPLLEYKVLEKMRGTYALALMKHAVKDGRVHTTFKQTGASTGRLSSQKPNLQNIPTKEPWGPLFKRAFIPKPGYKFIVADYSQVELRVVAVLAQDEEMLKVFRSGGDIHTTTCEKVLGIVGKPTTDQRRLAKNINFGMVYGLSAGGLQKYLEVAGVIMDLRQCAQIIKNFFNTYSGVARWIKRTQDFGKFHGYTATVWGRRRYFPEVFSKHTPTVNAALNGMVNHPVQGTAADIMKLAMTRMNEYLLLQVHDEVVLEVPEDKAEEELDKVVKIMARAGYDIMGEDIFVAEGGIGDSWGGAKH